MRGGAQCVTGEVGKSGMSHLYKMFNKYLLSFHEVNIFQLQNYTVQETEDLKTKKNIKS